MSALRVWAPRRHAVTARLWPDGWREGDAGTDVQLHAEGTSGWFVAEIPLLRHGVDYALLLDGGDRPLPDPRSRWQPHGVHAPSRWYADERWEDGPAEDEAAPSWTDERWHGRPLAGGVFYELHVGTFTAEGTFDAAIGRLDHLVDLGISHVELLPCNGFDGQRGWGYDGVAWYTVYEPYGGPDGLKRFVDACHARGLGVIMDVVYNHLGPAGNYLGEFGPYLTDKHTTPWGQAINLDAEGSDEVRRYIIDNALLWLDAFHCDGLRLDAVHALVDERATHLLEELAVAVDRLGARLVRPLFLVAESDLNDPKVVTERAAGGYGLDGQWCDDVHHAVWAALSGERQGYYADFGTWPVLAKAMTRAFVHDGTFSSFRGRRHGRPVNRELVPGWRFVTYLSDHDQVGNRAQGDRPSAALSPGRLRIGAALILLSPFTPMIFMGEEWGAGTPWQFFSDHAGDLGEAVRQGRRAEFAGHGWDAAEVPDPQDPATRDASVLDWTEPTDSEKGHADLLGWYRTLIGLRRRWTELADGDLTAVRVDYDGSPDPGTPGWITVRRGDLILVCVTGPEATMVPVEGNPVEVLAASGPFTFGPGGIEVPGEGVVVARLVAAS
jgi:maltooligosyltrehalose trehalohydrolase